MRLTVAEIAAATGGRVVAGDPAAVVAGATTDSRIVPPGSLWVAIIAARDGHDFALHAVEAGAGGLLVAAEATGAGPVAGIVARGSVAVVAVPDTALGLTALGRTARDRLGDATVVGVTGSSGKTSTKDLLVAALGTSRRVAAATASYNNEIGVPLTLLGAADDAEAVVVEMGMRGPGQIAALCAVARPTVGVVTNVGLAHAELAGGREGVARAKGELPAALGDDGVAVLPADDPALPVLAQRTRARVLTFGSAVSADVRVEGMRLDDRLRPSFHLATPWGGASVSLSVHGAHQAVNAAAAAAVALAVGAPLEAVVAGLEDARASRWRSELVETPAGALVLDDAYNANPDSLAAALRSLAALTVGGRRFAVLGRMAELGDHAPGEHRRAGELAAGLGIDVVVGVGEGLGELLEAARRGGATTHHVGDAAAAVAWLQGRVRASDAVLVKASRVVGLEVVADGLGVVRTTAPAHDGGAR